MRRLAPAIPAALALALAGCGGGGEPSGGVQGVETGRKVTGPPDAWATDAELAWLGEVADWSAAFAAAGRRVAELETDPDRFERALIGDPQAVAEYRAVLRPIRSCPESFARAVGPAPTGRLRESARNFADSCGHFRRGVALLLEALAEQDEDLTEDAREEIVEAGKRAALASGTLPPGEKQELPVLEGPSEHSRIDPRYSDAAGAVADKPVEARCWSPDDWKRLMVEEEVYTRGKVNEAVLGFASAGGRRINLAPSICEDLDALAAGERPRRAYEAALALVTLAHEGVHASGVVDEPTAECHGVQLADEAAERLGIDGAYADELVGVYWDAYPRLPHAYRSPECRDGGALDLDDGEGGFP